MSTYTIRRFEAHAVHLNPVRHVIRLPGGTVIGATEVSVVVADADGEHSGTKVTISGWRVPILKDGAAGSRRSEFGMSPRDDMPDWLLRLVADATSAFKAMTMNSPV